MDEEAGYGREEGNRLGGVRPDDQAKEGVELIDHHHSKMSDLQVRLENKRNMGGGKWNRQSKTFVSKLLIM